MAKLIADDGTTYDIVLTTDEIELLNKIKRNNNGYNRVNQDEKFWYVHSCGKVTQTIDKHNETDSELYNIANYYSTEDKANERAEYLESINKLERYARDNDVCILDWKNYKQIKYFISYDCKKELFYINNSSKTKHTGVIYFSSFESAKDAIKLFENELLLINGVKNE